MLSIIICQRRGSMPSGNYIMFEKLCAEWNFTFLLGLALLLRRGEPLISTRYWVISFGQVVDRLASENRISDVKRELGWNMEDGRLDDRQHDGEHDILQAKLCKYKTQNWLMILANGAVDNGVKKDIFAWKRMDFGGLWKEFMGERILIRLTSSKSHSSTVCDLQVWFA